MKLVLLPGMDGAGDLFTGFIAALPDSIQPQIVRYPKDQCLSYPELLKLVQAPVCEPFVLLAESFSSPLAIQFAATSPPNLKALILCAGFTSSPIIGWRRTLALWMAPILFRIPLYGWAARLFLIGPSTPPLLLAEVRAAVSSVRSEVLTDRLRNVLTCDAREELAEIVVPILCLTAKHDRLVNESSLKEVRNTHPQAIVAEVDGPHLILQGEPRISAEIVADFVRQLS
jgi:pimeloyl-[acyl-carrier protein] methyl ester esterase